MELDNAQVEPDTIDLDFVFGRVVHPEIEIDEVSLPLTKHPIDRPPFYEVLL